MSTMAPSFAGSEVSLNLSLNGSDRIRISGFPPALTRAQTSSVAYSKHSAQTFATST